MSDVFGINEVALDSVVLSISNHNDDLAEALNKIDDVVDTIDDCLKADFLVNFKNKFALMRANNSIIQANVQIYCSDLVRVKSGMFVIEKDALNKAISSCNSIFEVGKKNIFK